MFALFDAPRTLTTKSSARMESQKNEINNMSESQLCTNDKEKREKIDIDTINDSSPNFSAKRFVHGRLSTWAASQHRQSVQKKTKMYLFKEEKNDRAKNAAYFFVFDTSHHSLVAADSLVSLALTGSLVCHSRFATHTKVQTQINWPQQIT